MRVFVLRTLALLTILSEIWINANPVRCPNDNNIVGYVNLIDLNEDIQQEAARIRNGATPAPSYSFILCPNTAFDTSVLPLIPLLSKSTFTCGDDGQSDNCVFLGGSEQVRIGDSDISGYTIQELAFVGITFAQFGGNTAMTGTSISVTATDDTKVEFRDSRWTNFGDADFVIRIDPPSASNARVNVIDSTIENGNAGVIFDNNAAALSVSTSIIRASGTSISAVGNGGESFISNSIISDGSFSSVVFVTGTATHTIQGTVIEDMQFLERAFLVEGSGSRLQMSGSLVRNNVPTSNGWTIVNVQRGATATIDETSFDNNENLAAVVRVTNTGSTVNLNDSSLSGNVGTGGSGSTSSVLFGFQDARLNVMRTEFENNSGFTGEILLFSRSSMDIQRSCVQSGVSDFLVFSDRLSSVTATENYSSDYITPANRCGNNPRRVFQEQATDGCFVGGTCQGRCLLFADQSSCLAQEVDAPTRSPTVPPTNLPTPVTSSQGPTTELPTTFTAVPSTAPSPQGTEPTLAPTTRSPSATEVPTVSISTEMPTFGKSDFVRICPDGTLAQRVKVPIHPKSVKSPKAVKAKHSKSGKSFHSNNFGRNSYISYRDWDVGNYEFVWACPKRSTKSRRRNLRKTS